MTWLASLARGISSTAPARCAAATAARAAAAYRPDEHPLGAAPQHPRSLLPAAAPQGSDLVSAARPLPNHGVGAHFFRVRYARYAEPSFVTVTRVVPGPGGAGGKVWGLVTFRGESYGRLQRLRGSKKREWLAVDERSTPAHWDGYDFAARRAEAEKLVGELLERRTQGGGSFAPTEPHAATEPL
jgi:hypothetical protein